MRPASVTSIGGTSTCAPSWIASAVAWSVLATWMYVFHAGTSSGWRAMPATSKPSIVAIQ